MKIRDRMAMSLQIRIHAAISYAGYGLAKYRFPGRAPLMRRVREMRRDWSTLQTPMEAYQLMVLAASVGHLPGEVAEVGVYRGGTALMLAEALPVKRLHLCDTFDGLPEGENQFDKGDYSGAFREVKARLNGKAVFHKGRFPQETGPHIEHCRFCFVHLDVDIYSSTLDSLRWFYPRMVPGGIILTHDHPTSRGVVDAWNEFFGDKPEPSIELPGNQAMVVKLA